MDHLSSSPTNEELAARAKNGCISSFEHLVVRFQVPLLHYLQQLVSGGDAEDVLQETFVRAYVNLQSYRSDWRFSTWLFTIARRVSINHRRRRRPLADTAALMPLQSPHAGPVQIVIAEENRDYLWAAARRILGEEELSALWMHYTEELPLAEIATILERSVVSVKTMMFRARRKLQPHIHVLRPEGRRTEPSPLPVEVSND